MRGHLFVDVSSNQSGVIDWHRVAAPGLVFGAIVKTTEGADWNDPRFLNLALGARHAGLKVGAYHFARPDHNPPAAEAAHFLRVTAGKPFDMRPVLDFETAGHVGAVDPVAWAREFNHHVHAARGVFPVFYSSSSFAAELHASKPIGGGLWVASFSRDGTEHPFVIPSPWKHAKAHQFTSAAHVAGISGRVDLSHADDPHALLLAAA